jgi:hypothetical protein
MNKTILGWIAGTVSLVAMMYVLTLFPAPTEVWVSYSDRFYDSEGFQDPFWYGMLSISMLLTAVAIGRSVVGVSNRQLKPFIFMTVYLAMATFVIEAIVAQLQGIPATVIEMILTLAVLYGLFILFTRFRDDINGHKSAR